MSFRLPQPAHCPVNDIRSRIQPIPQNNITPQPTPFSRINSVRANAAVQDNIYVANFNFRAIKTEDLPFFKNDRLEILDFTEGEWWLAKCLKTNKTGFIPSNYVEKLNPTESVKPYFFGENTRDEAETMLLESANGTFIIRNSENRPSDFTLSVKYDNCVEHYPVVKTMDGIHFFIVRQTKFKNLDDLVSYYSRDDHSDGLCVKLEKPFPKPMQNNRSMAVANNQQPFDEYEIDRHSFQTANKIGEGKYCKVFHGRWENTKVAIKQLNPGTMTAADFLIEAENMKKLEHRKLLRLLAICSTSEPICMITEYMAHGSLLAYLKADHIDMYKLIDMAAQIATGMNFMESQKYIHRNLAARNILVGLRNNVKIADFGLAKFLGQNDSYTAASGERFPIKWTAPEASKHSRFSVKSDVWSFGILMHELVTFGEMPYKEMRNADVLANLESGYRMQCPMNCHLRMYDIMLKCWSGEPVDRPSFKDLQNTLEFLLMDYQETL